MSWNNWRKEILEIILLVEWSGVECRPSLREEPIRGRGREVAASSDHRQSEVLLE